MFSGLCGALPVNSGEVNLTRFSETFGVFSSLSLHFVLQQRQWGIQAKEAFWGKLLKKPKEDFSIENFWDSQIPEGITEEFR